MIEEARIEDLEDIYQLICLLENKMINKDHFINVYQAGLKNKDVVFLIYREDKVLGFLSFYVHKYLHHDRDTGEIVELVVSPEHRNLQIGHHLLCEIEKIAKKMQLEQIELSTSTYRLQAHRFYEKHGYEKNHFNYTKEL